MRTVLIPRIPFRPETIEYANKLCCPPEFMLESFIESQKSGQDLTIFYAALESMCDWEDYKRQENVWHEYAAYILLDFELYFQTTTFIHFLLHGIILNMEIMDTGIALQMALDEQQLECTVYGNTPAFPCRLETLITNVDEALEKATSDEYQKLFH